MSDDADHVVLTLARGDRGELRLSRSRFEGHTFTKFQIWYPGQDGELHPGRQVVTIRDHELHDVIAALQRIANKIGVRPAVVAETRTRSPGQRPLMIGGAIGPSTNPDPEGLF
jgi:hypothetical protein